MTTSSPFCPGWHPTTPLHTGNSNLEFTKYQATGYGENSRKHTQEWFDDLARNEISKPIPRKLQSDNAGQLDLRFCQLISLNFSSLRADGTGYPFDTSIPPSGQHACLIVASFLPEKVLAFR